MAIRYQFRGSMNGECRWICPQCSKYHETTMAPDKPMVECECGLVMLMGLHGWVLSLTRGEEP